MLELRGLASECIGDGILDGLAGGREARGL